jgi:glycosyltransferase involved in cell wall biosynthesis
MTAVHQALAGVGPFDAVSGQARGWRRILTEAGYGGGDHAARIDPRVGDLYSGLDRLRPDPGDLVVIRYSAWSPPLTPLLSLDRRRLLHYHNITPASFMWNHAPVVAVQCAVGRAQLPAFAAGAAVCTADSRYNADELESVGAREARVVPIVFDAERYTERGPAPEGEGPLILCVGRLAPNKRHDLIFDAFAAYQRECAPDARLVCVGETVSPSYLELVERLAAESGASGVELPGALDQPAVNALYASADALLHLSDHEGFCIPLLEAFHFDLPVVAKPMGAMPGVAGDAALWTTDDPAVTAELLDLAVRDGDLRGELARRGRERLAGYSAEEAERAVLAAVDAAVS